tara:strand:- start:84 stop:893 length:810 start_codon:yes stop_codon:yes gene_type:complete
MPTALAPRPKNEDRRVVAVKRTGIIDGQHRDNFSIFCEIAKELTGFDRVSFSLFDENFQCNIANTDDTKNEKSERHEFNICAYVLLSSEPTLIPDLRLHDRWKNHPKVLNGEGSLGYAGFPVINKDNYALGTFCLLNKEPAKLSKHQIKLLKGIAGRIAHQIDIQTEQREITADSVQNALKSFTAVTKSENFTHLNDFLSLCVGKPVANEAFSVLVNLGLAEYEKSEMILSEAGKTLQTKMKLQTKVMKRSIIKTQNKPTFLDELLGEL